MISPQEFYGVLDELGVEFYSGVPDSVLRNFTDYVFDTTEADQHNIAANEGLAISTAAGYQLATGKIPVVYMQNAGLGNAINPLVSLCHKTVYNIPLLLIVGWRGSPLTEDEPQHKLQGTITKKILNLLEIPTVELNSTSDFKQRLIKIYREINDTQKTYALLVEPNTFSKYQSTSKIHYDSFLSRYSAIHTIQEFARPNNYSVLVTTGKASREIFEINEYLDRDQKDFLMVGSMGHLTALALGLAKSKVSKKIICLDGDGAFLMHLGGVLNLTTLTNLNMIHIILNNQIHESVGSMPTGINRMKLEKFAESVNYSKFFEVKNEIELIEVLKASSQIRGVTLINIQINSKSKKKLMRPNVPLLEIKKNFLRSLDETKRDSF
jgi:phosphonopyruvate decarboxylase